VEQAQATRRPRNGFALRLRGSRVTALALGGVGLVALAAAIPLVAVAHHASASVPIMLACGPSAAIGCLIVYRQPRNPVGWTLLALGAGTLIGLDGTAYSVLRYRHGYTALPLGTVAAFVSPLMWVSPLILLPLPLLLFPEGRLSTRWRWVLRAYVVVAAVWFVGLVILDVEGLTRRRVIDSNGSYSIVDHPRGWDGFVTNGLVVIAYLALSLAAVARQLLAFRGSIGEQRQQLKWLLGGGAVCSVGLFATLTIGNGSSSLDSVVGGVGIAAIAALPAGIGVGILKYRLYDIDRLISRTISYTIVTGLLVGVFTGLVLFATRALPFSSPVGVAAATLAAAGLFNPLRRRTQRLVDRRFNRARYDVEATVATFAGRLRDSVDLDTIRDELLEATGRALEPADAFVWVRPDPSPRS
jgi:hypothetical protein